MTKALVADDSKIVRMVVKRALRDIGVSQTVEAGDGDEAVRMYHDSSVDLVLLDWHMPGKTGLEVTREIRQVDADVPIIIMTAEAGESYVQQAMQAAASDYLVKPFDCETLREKLERHFR